MTISSTRRRRANIKSKRQQRYDSDEIQVRRRDPPRAGAGEEHRDLLRFEELMVASPCLLLIPKGMKAR
jgi:hypothetical protein